MSPASAEEIVFNIFGSNFNKKIKNICRVNLESGGISVSNKFAMRSDVK